MTIEIRKALERYRNAHEEHAQFVAEESLGDALRAWCDAEIATAVKKCIRIASECQHKNCSPADVIAAEFSEIL